MGNGHKENRNGRNGGPTARDNFVAELPFSSCDKSAKVDSSDKITAAVKEAVSASMGPDGMSARIGDKVALTFDDKGAGSVKGPVGLATLILEGRIGQGISNPGISAKAVAVTLQGKGNDLMAYSATAKATFGPFAWSSALASGTININPIQAVEARVPEAASYAQRSGDVINQKQRGDGP